MEVGAWLRGLGLGQYERAFRDNDIGARVLPGLTADDLKEIGVASVGHRRLMLRAIAELSAAPAPEASAKAAVEAIAASAAHAHAPPQAERRQLTVMFADLVDSTALSARLDPEEMGKVLRAYQDAVAGTVARLEGHVAKFTGDGVLAYFGWPQAHEDDAERAVRTGLAVVDGVGRLPAPGGEPLATRVGIATGLVVVGDPLGEGAAREATVVGETPNLAARLQTVAAPGWVVLAEGTRRLLGAAFELDDLGAKGLKGFAEPVPAWRVVGIGRAEGRFEALRGAVLTPLVGRERELDLLLERWARARGGEGQVVLLSGEAGIGKSRLVRALRDRLAAEPHTTLYFQCSPHHASSALWPVVEQLERAAGIARDDPPAANLDRLATLLGEAVADAAPAVPLLADLLGLPAAGHYPAPDLSPQRRKAETLEALLARLEGLAARGPMLVVLEDAHWLDPTSRELFDLLARRLRHLPVLLLATSRPEFRPSWADAPHATLLTLNRLGARQALAIAERVAWGRALPAGVAEQIVERTDGVPLFVEELTKTLLEGGLLERDGPLPPLSVPSTLHDSLAARLDRLGPVKEVAQIGAVIGREFPHTLLAAVSGLDDAVLRDAIRRLAEAGLVFALSAAPDALYSFKHALVRDAAYEGLLKSRRQQLHARIADTLEGLSPAVAEAQPEVIAEHLAEAGQWGRAAEYWTLAGEHATRRSANLEAMTHLSRGLEAVQKVPDGGERTTQELRLRVALCAPLIALKGFGAPETAAAFAAAKVLAERTGDRSFLFPLLYDEYFVSVMQADYRKGEQVTARFLALAERAADPGLEMIARRVYGVARLLRGDLAEGRRSLEASVALYDPDRHIPLTFQYGLANPKVAALSFLGRGLQLSGYAEQARRCSDEAVGLARELGHANSLAFALIYGAAPHHHAAGDAPATAAALRAFRGLPEAQRLPMWRAYADVFEGWVLVRERRPSDGLARVEAGLEALAATASRFERSQMLAVLAEAQIATGGHAAAAETLDAALAFVAQSDERYFEAELLRLRAECRELRGGSREGALADLGTALEVARAQGARTWELRAAVSLARLWTALAERRKARDLLAPIHAWFTEGFDAPDLKEAKALLEELASASLGSRVRPRRRPAAPVNNAG